MNKSYISHFLFILMMTASSTVVAAQDAFTILFLGDSLTEGYGLDDGDSFPSLIEEKLQAENKSHISIINAGITGSTSASGPARLQWYIRSQPNLMVLSLGANDGLRGLNVDEMKSNLSKTIVFAIENGVQVILTGMQVPPNYGPEYTEEFANVFPDLAKQHDIPLMPFLLEGVAAITELNQSDGIHPNIKGTHIVADNMYHFLLPFLPET